MIRGNCAVFQQSIIRASITKSLFQIEKLEADSETAKQKAVTAKKHVEDAAEQLDRIKELVKNLSDRNLSDLVEQLNNDRRTTEIADSLSVSLDRLILIST